VKGFRTKIVTNTCATRKRLYSALNVKPEKLYQKLAESWRSPTQPKIIKTCMQIPTNQRITKIIDEMKKKMEK